MATRGIHVIWTTYDTWLPGDDRGHWSPLFDLYGKIQCKGDQLNPPDAHTRRVARTRMKEPEKILTSAEIKIVAEVIGQHLAPGMPGAMWCIHAAALEQTHVHLHFGPLEDHIANVAGRLKSSISAAVLRWPENSNRHRTWTDGYWKVFIFDQTGIEAVREYIVEHNRRRGLPDDPYSWIAPI